MDEHTFYVDEKVYKPSGYNFVGTVQSVFTTRKGEVRYVIENSHSTGLLHIFSGKQLALVDGPRKTEEFEF